LIALVAALTLLSATAVAGGHRVVVGTSGGDELSMRAAGNRVFARAGDDVVDGGGGNDRLRGGRGDDELSGGPGNDRLRGGQDEDILDGGQGDDYLNGRGDGADRDEIVCGDGHDTVVLGRNDVVMVDASAANEELDADEPELDEPEPGDDDGCEKVKGPGEPKACASHDGGCEEVDRPCVATSRECAEEDQMPCVATDGACEGPAEETCAATYRDCDDPVATEPELDPVFDARSPGKPGP
jgi:Ca2+-binding RTX toxin-like protein